jgi:hypothetical protein
MVAAHHACANHANAQHVGFDTGADISADISLGARCGPFGTHVVDPNRFLREQRPGDSSKTIPALMESEPKPYPFVLTRILHADAIPIA